MRVYAPMQGLLQSAEWIGQPFKPAKLGRESGENECSAYIFWGKGNEEGRAKTDMSARIQQESSQKWDSSS